MKQQLGTRTYPPLARAADAEKIEPGDEGHVVELLEPVGEGPEAETKLVAMLQFLEPEPKQYEKYVENAMAKEFAWVHLQHAIVNVEMGNVKDPSRAGELIEGFFMSSYRTLTGAVDLFYEFLVKCEAQLDGMKLDRDRFNELFIPTSVLGTQRYFDANEVILAKLNLTVAELGN